MECLESGFAFLQSFFLPEDCFFDPLAFGDVLAHDDRGGFTIQHDGHRSGRRPDPLAVRPHEFHFQRGVGLPPGDASHALPDQRVIFGCDGVQRIPPHNVLRALIPHKARAGRVPIDVLAVLEQKYRHGRPLDKGAKTFLAGLERREVLFVSEQGPAGPEHGGAGLSKRFDVFRN